MGALLLNIWLIGALGFWAYLIWLNRDLFRCSIGAGVGTVLITSLGAAIWPLAIFKLFRKDHHAA